MEYMDTHTNYILAGLRNKNDPNVATAYGVVGSIIGAVGEANISGLRRCARCGNVGATVAKILLEKGATVYTIDKDPQRANIGTANNISDDVVKKDLATNLLEHDVFVPCSSSRLIDENFPSICSSSVQLIVGATNLPFIQFKGRKYIPGVAKLCQKVCSAGAVIVDSIEHYDLDTFASAKPQHVYNFVKDIVANKHKRPSSCPVQQAKVFQK